MRVSSILGRWLSGVYLGSELVGAQAKVLTLLKELLAELCLVKADRLLIGF